MIFIPFSMTDSLLRAPKCPFSSLSAENIATLIRLGTLLLNDMLEQAHMHTPSVDDRRDLIAVTVRRLSAPDASWRLKH